MSYPYNKNGIYFISQKTVSDKKFFREEKYKDLLMSQLVKASEKFNIEIIAYAILSNHYHLLLKIKNLKELSSFFQLLHGGTSFFYNKMTGVNRSLWQNDKYCWQAIKEKQYYRFLGYILGNPLKHLLVYDYVQLRQYKYTNLLQVEKILGKELLKNIIKEAITFEYDDLTQ